MRHWLLIIILSISTGGLADAAVVSVVASDTGFVTEMGGSSKGDGTLVPGAEFNYSVGQELHFADGGTGSPLAYMDRKNYFIFDLSTVTDTIVSATFNAYMGPDSGMPFPAMNGYESLDPTEEFALFGTSSGSADDVLDIAGALIEEVMTGGAGAFDDATDSIVMTTKDMYAIMGDGPVLGAIETSPADNGLILSISFTPDGIDYLNSHLGDAVVLSGSILSIGAPSTTESIFGFTGPDIADVLAPGPDPLIPELEVTTVPEPGCLLACALMQGVWGSRKRRRINSDK